MLNSYPPSLLHHRLTFHLPALTDKFQILFQKKILKLFSFEATKHFNFHTAIKSIKISKKEGKKETVFFTLFRNRFIFKAIFVGINF